MLILFFRSKSGMENFHKWVQFYSYHSQDLFYLYYHSQYSYNLSHVSFSTHFCSSPVWFITYVNVSFLIMCCAKESETDPENHLGEGGLLRSLKHMKFFSAHIHLNYLLQKFPILEGLLRFSKVSDFFLLSGPKIEWKMPFFHIKKKFESGGFHSLVRPNLIDVQLPFQCNAPL